MTRRALSFGGLLSSTGRSDSTIERVDGGYELIGYASSTQGYTALAELVWQMSTPFTDWWAVHPRYHRESCAA